MFGKIWHDSRNPSACKSLFKWEKKEQFCSEHSVALWSTAWHHHLSLCAIVSAIIQMWTNVMTLRWMQQGSLQEPDQSHYIMFSLKQNDMQHFLWRVHIPQIYIVYNLINHMLQLSLLYSRKSKWHCWFNFDQTRMAIANMWSLQQHSTILTKCLLGPLDAKETWICHVKDFASWFYK